MIHRSIWVLAALCAVASVSAGAASPTTRAVGRKIEPISIVIDGTKLAVDPAPRFYKYHLLVPVRRIIEALGLGFEDENGRIVTHAGYKTIELRVGSRLAHVDGRAVVLDSAPVEIGYTLYAPLRFFTAALGAQASFDRQTNSVDIVSTLIGRSGNGIVANGSGEEEIGTVTAIDENSVPSTITLTYNASVRTLNVNASAEVVVQDVNADTSNPGTIGDVHVGDFAHLYLDRSGNVERIVDAYGSRGGRIAAVGDGELVLGDGHVIAPDKATSVTLNGSAATLRDLRVGDAVTVRYNIDSSEVRQIVATRPGAAGSTVVPASGIAIVSVEADATAPLRAGESFTVTLRGTPGGEATYDIGPYLVGLPLTEKTPGVYTAVYTASASVSFADAPIFGHLEVDGMQAPTAESQNTISVSSVPPVVSDYAPGDGAVVNNHRPSIYATFHGSAIGVNPSSASIAVNGHDVTSASVRTARFIEYTPGIAYPDGPMHVVVHVSDRAGNTAVKRWTFFIKTSRVSESSTLPSLGRLLPEYFVAHQSRSYGFAPSSRLVSEQNSAQNPKTAQLRHPAR